MFELPPRMTQLQALIRGGQVSAQEALLAQVRHGQSLKAHSPCVVDELPIGAPGAGPLAGIALAHKDIFQTNGRVPGCGVGPGRAHNRLPMAAALAALAERPEGTPGELGGRKIACAVTATGPAPNPFTAATWKR